MNVTTNVEKTHAFVLGSEDVLQLWNQIGLEIGYVEANAVCSDDMERKFQTPEELVNYENPRSRAIVEISLIGRSADHASRAEVHFFGGERLRSITMRASGEEESISRLKAGFGELVDGMRPWYSPIVHVDFFFIVMAALLIGLSVLNMVVGDRKETADSGMAPGMAILVTVVLGALVFGSIAITLALNRLRRRFFPVATFALGQGIRRNDIDEKIRWIVIVGLLVSICGSLIAALVRT